MKECLLALVTFLSSNFIQNIILLSSAGITIIIFHRKLTIKKRTAIITLCLQIKSMKKNFENVKLLVEDEGFDIKEMLKAVKIINENSWENYRSLLTKEFSKEEIILINDFYEKAIAANELIEDYHRTIIDTYESFYIKNLSTPINELPDTLPYIRSSTIHKEALNECCIKALNLYEYMPLEKMKRFTK